MGAMRALAAAALAVVAAAQPAPDYNCTGLAAAGAFQTYTLRSRRLEARFVPYGATMTHMIVPDKHGNAVDVALGFDNATEYCAFPQHPYFGATIGRVANRIFNGTFQLDNQTYYTPRNENNYDTLHGGTIGYDRRQWTLQSSNASALVFSYYSPDGEMGFPGDLAITVTHSLQGDDTWRIDYEATTSSDGTVVALTNHAYWNLNANVGGAVDVLDHEVAMRSATTFLEVDAHLIPTGNIYAVDNASWAYLDFTKPKPVGRDIANGTVAPGGGYDNAWAFANWQPTGRVEPRVDAYSSITGIGMQVSTDQPSVQFYTGNFLNGTIPRKASQGGPTANYQHFGAVVFEAQHFPDSVHHPDWPSVVLRPGQTYRQTTTYRFLVA